MTRVDFEELAISFTRDHVRELYEWSTSSIKFKCRLAALLENTYFAAMHDAANYADSCQRDVQPGGNRQPTARNDPNPTVRRRPMKTITKEGSVHCNPLASGCMVGLYTKSDKPMGHIGLTWEDAEALHKMLGQLLKDRGSPSGGDPRG